MKICENISLSDFSSSVVNVWSDVVPSVKSFTQVRTCYRSHAGSCLENECSCLRPFIVSGTVYFQILGSF